MQAMILTRYGAPDALELKELPQPTPKPGEVMVRIHACSINDWDRELLLGIPFVNRMMAGITKPSRVRVLGCDIAGRVEAVGEGVTRFSQGDAVYGDLSSNGWGGFAEYVATSEKALAPIPSGMSFVQAAATPQAGLLALQGLRKGCLQAGQRVLINGASGGTGTFAVQIARASGAEVTGVCSTQKMELVHSLGVERVIDYTCEDFTQGEERYDLILDVKAFHPVQDVRRALAPQGRYVMLGGPSILPVILLGGWTALTSRQHMGLLLHRANVGLEELGELYTRGSVVPVVDRCFALTELADAFRYFMAGRAQGKVVISLVDDG